MQILQTLSITEGHDMRVRLDREDGIYGDGRPSRRRSKFDRNKVYAIAQWRQSTVEKRKVCIRFRRRRWSEHARNDVVATWACFPLPLPPFSLLDYEHPCLRPTRALEGEISSFLPSLLPPSEGTAPRMGWDGIGVSRVMLMVFLERRYRPPPPSSSSSSLPLFCCLHLFRPTR